MRNAELEGYKYCLNERFDADNAGYYFEVARRLLKYARQLHEENEHIQDIIAGIPLDRLEEICKAYKEDRIIILPKCPKCGLVNAWGIGKRNCDRCGALLYKQAEAALKEAIK